MAEKIWKFCFLGYTILILLVGCFNVISTLFFSSLSIIESSSLSYFLGYVVGQAIYLVATFIVLLTYTYDKRKSYKIGFCVGLFLMAIGLLLGNIIVTLIWFLFVSPYVFSSYKLWKSFK